MYTHQYGFHQNPALSYGQPFYPPMQQQMPQVIYSNRRLQHINCVIPQSEESGGLFIGDTISTLKTQYITENNISAILCMNSEASRNIHMTKLPFDFKYIESVDHVEYPIKLHFESANDYIHSNLKKKKNVLVQCHAGVSRSATIICAYLIKHYALTPEQALSLLKEKRHRAKPNMGFLYQLQEYWSHLNSNKKENNQINQINFKTPQKKSRQDSIVLTPTKHKQNQKITSQEVIDLKFNSQNMIAAKTQREKTIQKQIKTEKKPKIFADMSAKKKNHQLRHSQDLQQSTPFQYFNNQHRTPQPVKKNSFEQQNYIHRNPSLYYSPQQPKTLQSQQRLLHQSSVQFYQQPEQVYYLQVPQQQYANHPYMTSSYNQFAPMYRSHGY